MAQVFSLIALMTGLLVALLIRQSRIQRAEKLWKRVGREFGLEPQDGTAALLRGEQDGFSISITRQEGDRQKGKKPRMAVYIDGNLRIPGSIVLQREPMLNLGGRTDVTVGDPAFDSTVLVQGPEPLLLALLNESCRASVLTLSLKASMHVADGRLVYSVPCEDKAAVIEYRIHQAGELAQALSINTREVPGRLAENACSTDMPQVRRRNLAALAKLEGNEALARETALALLEDPEGEMRYAASLHFGPDELEPVLALANRERDGHVRAALLERLSKFAGDRLWPTIKEALRSGDELVQRAAAEAARATGYTELAPRIARKLERQLEKADPETLVSLAGALGALRDPTTEPTLVRLLSHDSKDVQRAAALGLGEFGSVAAVEPLLACSGRLLLGGETKTAVLAAVLRIQSRLGDVQVGALSLAEQDAHVGAVSLADETAADGALSLADGPREKKASD